MSYPYCGQFEHISGRCSFEGDTCDLFDRLGGGGVALEGVYKRGRSECWCLLQFGGEVVQCHRCLEKDLFHIVCYSEDAIEAIALLAVLLGRCAYPRRGSC